MTQAKVEHFAVDAHATLVSIGKMVPATTAMATTNAKTGAVNSRVNANATSSVQNAARHMNHSVTKKTKGKTHEH